MLPKGNLHFRLSHLLMSFYFVFFFRLKGVGGLGWWYQNDIRLLRTSHQEPRMFPTLIGRTLIIEPHYFSLSILEILVTFFFSFVRSVTRILLSGR